MSTFVNLHRNYDSQLPKSVCPVIGAHLSPGGSQRLTIDLIIINLFIFLRVFELLLSELGLIYRCRKSITYASFPSHLLSLVHMSVPIPYPTVCSSCPSPLDLYSQTNAGISLLTSLGSLLFFLSPRIKPSLSQVFAFISFVHS